MDVWKRKLLAFLHDPPCKPFDIAGHGEDARLFARQAGVTDPEELRAFDRDCDWIASAADRFPFPDSRASGLRSSFDGAATNPFRHPLGGACLEFADPIPSAGVALEIFQQTQPGVQTCDLSAFPEDSERHWANFFLHWRRWPEEAAARDSRTAFLPADTRIPDHTVWNHMSLTSAFQSCMDGDKRLRPAFLLFQLGPVQEFIVQARSTRDLWSGSYLLSWLTGHAIKAVTDQTGPDAVIFPALRGQPIFDALHRTTLYEKVLFTAGNDGSQHTLWQRLGHRPADLLTPTLPNRFLALVPEWRGAAYAAAAQSAAQAALCAAGDAVWPWIADTAASAGVTGEDVQQWRRRWDEQLRLFLRSTWQLMPWRSSVAECLGLFEELPVGKTRGEPASATPAAALHSLYALATRLVPEAHRDRRCFADSAKTQLSGNGFTWPVQYALTDYALAARRNTRDFPAWETDEHQSGAGGDGGAKRK